MIEVSTDISRDDRGFCWGAYCVHGSASPVVIELGKMGSAQAEAQIVLLVAAKFPGATIHSDLRDLARILSRWPGVLEDLRSAGTTIVYDPLDTSEHVLCHRATRAAARAKRQPMTKQQIAEKFRNRDLARLDRLGVGAMFRRKT